MEGLIPAYGLLAFSSPSDSRLWQAKMSTDHICVCICTFRRPNLLSDLLSDLEAQETSGMFGHSVVVVDNDDKGSARDVVEAFARRSRIAVSYEIEPEQNISLARNRAVRNSVGDYMAFFDDDQSPRRDWLRTLYLAQQGYQADGVLGPVKPIFDENPPQWVVKGDFYERPTHATGMVIGWRNGRTGNVLIRRSVLAGDPQPFDPRFGSGGEDQDFFRRKICEGLPVRVVQRGGRDTSIFPLPGGGEVFFEKGALAGQDVPPAPEYGVEKRHDLPDRHTRSI